MFAKIAHKIRHSPLLKNADILWNILRKPYHALLNIRSKGIPVIINESLTIRIPPQYYKINLSDYEEASTQYLINWINKNPSCLILDIGCSTGYISAVCLFASANATVIGFDSDLPSLRASELMCKYAPGNRFSVLYGLITEGSNPERNINEAIDATNKILKASNLSGNPDTTKYVNLDKNIDKLIPEYAMDSLFKGSALTQPILIKCDIEGAELFALKGAKQFIAQYKPAILLSVHPGILPVFNCTVQQVDAFLKEQGYAIELISIDHEEHWWCVTK